MPESALMHRLHLGDAVLCISEAKYVAHDSPRNRCFHCLVYKETPFLRFSSGKSTYFVEI
jgi:hypothetical protein